MKFNLHDTPKYSIASLEQNKSKTVLAYISADIHTRSSATSHAAYLVYTEALLSGAGRYNRAQFLDAINLLGASLGVSVSEGIFTVSIRSSAEAYKKVLSLLELVFNDPKFDKAEITRIKLKLSNEIKESKEDSKNIARKELRNSIYGLEDRRHEPSEDALIKEISAITAKDLIKLHKQIVASKWMCTQASKKSELELLDKAVKKCNKSKGEAEPLRLHQQKPPVLGLTLRDIPSRQNIDFSIGAPLPITKQHPDYAPLVLGLTVLGKWGGFTGRLMSTVREAEGLTYGIYAGTETFYREEQGYWRIMTFFSPDKAVQGLTSTFREVKKIHEHGITKEELDKFKKILKTGQALKNDSTASLLAELHGYHQQNFSLKEMTEFKDRVFNVSLAEVNSALKTYLNPNTLTVSGAGPVTRVKKDLESFIKSVA